MNDWPAGSIKSCAGHALEEVQKVARKWKGSHNRAAIFAVSVNTFENSRNVFAQLIFLDLQTQAQLQLQQFPRPAARIHANVLRFSPDPERPCKCAPLLSHLLAWLTTVMQMCSTLKQLARRPRGRGVANAAVFTDPLARTKNLDFQTNV